MYKRLNSEDFTTNYMSIIEPAGVASDGTLVSNTDYVVEVGNLNGSNSEKFRYRQLANIVKGDSTSTPFSSKFPAGATITILTINRKNFKESIHPSSFEVGGVNVKSGSNDVEACEAGRVYKATDSSYYLYPDIGIASKAGVVPFGTVKACSEETVTVSHAHVYASPSEYNYSTNPSFSNNKDIVRFIDWHDNPITYITTIGFYNNNGDCLAVAKLPKPFKKDFHTAFSTTVEFKF